jgi:hypothetical protein
VIVVGIILIPILAIFLFLPARKKPSPAPVFSPLPKALDLETQNWETYDRFSQIQFKYPSQITVREAQDEVVLEYIGPSQGNDPELHDAIRIYFEIHDTDDLSLNQIVQNDYQDAQNSPVREVLTKYSETIMGGLSGYAYKSESMGEYTHYFFPLKNGKYLKITDATQDPQDQDFDKVVKLIFSTIDTNTN